MTAYLVSWVDTQNAYAGNGVLDLARPITCMDDVNALQRMLVEQHGMTSPVVMGFSRFENQEER